MIRSLLCWMRCLFGHHEYEEPEKIIISKYNWWYDKKCKICGVWKWDLWDNEEQRLKWENEHCEKVKR